MVYYTDRICICHPTSILEVLIHLLLLGPLVALRVISKDFSLFNDKLRTSTIGSILGAGGTRNSIALFTIPA